MHSMKHILTLLAFLLAPLAAQHPDVVKRLQDLIAKMDADLGIDKGKKKDTAPGVRPAGRVDNPQPLLLSGKTSTN